jgi:hypothetical protein
VELVDIELATVVDIGEVPVVVQISLYSTSS